MSMSIIISKCKQLLLFLYNNEKIKHILKSINEKAREKKKATIKCYTIQ